MFQNRVLIALGSNIGNWKINFNNSLIELGKISHEWRNVYHLHNHERGNDPQPFVR